MKLRNLMPKDTAGILTWMKDPEINCFFRMDSDKATEQSVLNFIESSQNQKKNMHLAVTDEEDNYLGTVSLKNIDNEEKNAEYAISICKTVHGSGVAKFATEEILRIAFEELSLHKVYLNVLSENIRANKFYEKSKFIYEGEFKEHVFVHGKFKDLKWYRILEEEYYNKNNAI